jgi:hypothetical protein
MAKNWKLKNGASGNANGRPRGSKNKFTQLKEAFLNAFEQTGGVDGLVSWVKASPHNRGQFYVLITKLFPTEIEHSGEIKLLKFDFGDNGNGDKE